ncbi:MAG TPA: tetratricopeptide repeat protein, partial [Flavobacterium sp.]|uniref:tetratricopeptide repeat protein n=1 Tax=Flavobacterium sp. TaxID=239 RepID=UPI002BCA357D
MMRRFFCLLIPFLFLERCTLKNNNKTILLNDKIQKNLKMGSNLKLSKNIREKCNNRVLSMLDIDKNDTLTRFYLSSLLFNYTNLDNESSFKTVSKLLFNKSTEAKDTLNLARYYRYKAGYFKKNAIDDSAFYYYIKAEKFYRKTQDELGLAKVYSNKRQLQYKYDDYTGSNLSAKKAYSYYKKSNNLEGQYHSLIAIGNNCTILKEYNNAVNAFQQALEILKKDKSIDNSGTCLNNLGNVYREEKKFKKAMYYLNLALKDKSLVTSDPCLVGFLLNNLSYCKLQLKEYKGVPEMLYKSVKLMKDEEGIKESTISYIYLSNYFIARHDTLKSQIYAEKALKIAKKYRAPYYYLSALSNAGSVDCKKASKYIVEYDRINDSLYFIENNTRNQYYSIQLETDDIKHEKEVVVIQKRIITGISGFVILVIVLLLIITKQRAKQKELRLLQEQQKNNEEIYDLMLVQKSKEEQARKSEKKRIALELHDGIMNKLASTRLNLNVLNHKNDDKTIKKC